MSTYICEKSLHILSDFLSQGYDPELLHKEYKNGWSKENPSYGFCAISAEVAWFLLGGKEAGWTAWNVRDEDGSTHWWLQHKDGVLFDPTRSQFDCIGKKPPYERGLPGRPGGFMGIRVDEDSPWCGARRPSIRASELMSRIGVVPGQLFDVTKNIKRGLRP